MISRERFQLMSVKSEYCLLCSTNCMAECRFRPSVASILKSYAAQVILLKPSFSRTKPAEKRKMRYSSEHPDADNSNKSSHLDAAASHADPVTSSSAILHMPVIQVSENHERKHAELLKNSCGGGGIAKVQQGYLEKRNLDTRKKSKEYTPGMPEVTKAIQDIDKVVLTTKVLNPTLKSVVANDEVTAEAKTTAKKDLDKKELIAVTKQKTVPEAVKDEFARKVRGYQNDELNKKVTKARAKPVDKDILNSTARTKAKPDVNNELITKVIDHHRRGELRLLTVADLKCFLGAKKAKVRGTKEVLIQRASELLA